ncbi:MAG: hypothetical protein ACR2KX_14060 [Chitinophagaceae bacterium]
MSPTDLKETLSKIQETDDKALLHELSVLFELHEPETLYELSDEQKKNIKTAQEQIKSNQFLTDDEANKDIDLWLNK